MKKKLKTLVLTSLLAVGFVVAPIISIYSIEKNYYEKENSNLNSEEEYVELGIKFLENLNDLYIEKGKVYSIYEAKELFNTLSIETKNKAIEFSNFYNDYLSKKENYENYLNEEKSEKKKVNLHVTSYWDFAVLKVFFDLKDCKAIADYANAISIGLAGGSLVTYSIPYLPLISGIISFIAAVIDNIFSDPGKNGLYIAFAFGFIPFHIQGY